MQYQSAALCSLTLGLAGFVQEGGMTINIIIIISIKEMISRTKLHISGA